MNQPARPTLDDFAHVETISTRWMDNDLYGHVNNVVYYSYFDTAVNNHLIRHGDLDIHNADIIGVVAETRCRFLHEISFPEVLLAGLRTTRLGNSSVTYAIGLFKQDGTLAALGHFVHVYIDRTSRRPVPIPAAIRASLKPLLGEPFA